MSNFERPGVICAMVADDSFSNRRRTLGSARNPGMDRSTSIVAETTKKILGEISLKNQQRNFLTGSVAEKVVAEEEYASDLRS